MAVIKWSDRFKIGEETLDKEHWGLFALIDDFDNKVRHDDNRESTEATLEALVDYVDYHFRHEEELMEKTGYPDLEKHKKSHAGLEKKLMIFQKNYNHNKDKFDFETFLEFLGEWLTVHILIHDMDFANFHKESEA